VQNGQASLPDAESVSRLEKNIAASVLGTQNAADLRKGAEWNKSYDEHQYARTELISANLVV